MPLVIRKEYLFLEFWWKLVGGKKSILAIRKLPFQPSSFASSYICLLVGSDPWVRPIFHRLNLTHPLGSIPRQSSFKIVNNDNEELSPSILGHVSWNPPSFLIELN